MIVHNVGTSHQVKTAKKQKITSYLLVQTSVELSAVFRSSLANYSVGPVLLF